MITNKNKFQVSHTTEDLIFEWEKEVPLVVDENIELPQFDIVKNHTADCSQEYSTGRNLILFCTMLFLFNLVILFRHFFIIFGLLCELN